MKRSVSIYVMAVVMVSLAMMTAVSFIGATPTPDDWTAAVFFSLLGLLAILLSYQSRGGVTSGSVTFLPFLSGILVSPTVATPIAIVAATFAANVLSRKEPAKALFNSAQFGIAASAAALILAPMGSLTENGFTFLHVVLFSIAAIAFIIANVALVVGVIALSEQRRYFPTCRRILSATLLYDVLAFPIIALLAWSYTTLGMGWLLAIVMPLLGLRQMYKVNAELEKSTEELLQLMVAAIEARDPYTSGHSRRVASYSRVIARAARLSPRDVERIGVAALLHDVGKIHEMYAPILRKAEALTDSERAIIETHPIKSADLVAKSSQLKDLVPAVRAHHERWDGLGYPDKLSGTAIPIGARIIAIADTVDAMRTTRPYRAALEMSVIQMELARGRGSQFDPAFVDAILDVQSWARLERTVLRFERIDVDEFLSADDLEVLELNPEESTTRAAARR
jgi:hypothetical protein